MCTQCGREGKREGGKKEDADINMQANCTYTAHVSYTCTMHSQTQLTAVLEAERTCVRFEGGMLRGRAERTCSHLQQPATYYPKEGMNKRGGGGGGKWEKERLWTAGTFMPGPETFMCECIK